MHAILITFRSAAPLDQLEEPFTAYANGMLGLPGFVGKTWITDGSTVGGFNVFVDRASADAYLAGELFSGVQSNPAFSNFEIRRFETLDGLSAITNGPRPAVAAR